MNEFGKRTVEEVYSRHGYMTPDGLLKVRRVIAAVEAMNGNTKGALENLKLDSPKDDGDYALSTVDTYWSEYQGLDEMEKNSLRKGNPDIICQRVERYLTNLIGNTEVN